MTDKINSIICGDSLTELKKLENESINCLFLIMNPNLKGRFDCNWYHCRIFENGNGDQLAGRVVVVVVVVVGPVEPAVLALAGVALAGAVPAGVALAGAGADAVVVGVGVVAGSGVLISYLHTGHLLSRINHEVIPDWVNI